MTDLVKVRNKDDVDRDVVLPDGSTVTINAGSTGDVPHDTAHGTPAVGVEGDDDFHPGTSGLLAQMDVWEPARAPKGGASPAPDDQPVTGEEG